MTKTAANRIAIAHYRAGRVVAMFRYASVVRAGKYIYRVEVMEW